MNSKFHGAQQHRKSKIFNLDGIMSKLHNSTKKKLDQATYIRSITNTGLHFPIQQSKSQTQMQEKGSLKGVGEFEVGGIYQN